MKMQRTKYCIYNWVEYECFARKYLATKRADEIGRIVEGCRSGRILYRPHGYVQPDFDEVVAKRVLLSDKRKALESIELERAKHEDPSGADYETA